MNNLKNILKKELKEMFRDKKSLSMMLIIPIMIPLLVLGMSALFELQMNKPIEDYNKIGFRWWTLPRTRARPLRPLRRSWWRTTTTLLQTRSGRFPPI